MSPKVYYQSERVTLWHGDCLAVLPTLSGVDAVVTDPPYGMKWDSRISRGPNGTGAANPSRNFGKTIVGDDAPFDPSPWLGFDRVVLWGSNHFGMRLPKGTTLVWIKRYDSGFGSFLSDAECAWMKGGHGVYCQRDVSLQGESGERAHPCQKPVGVMEWCIEQIGPCCTILDPFMGSGTTGVAAVRLGRKFIGIEIDEGYCAIAKRRIQEAEQAFALFEPATPEVQSEMFPLP